MGLTVLILALDVLTGAGVRLGGLLAFLPAFATAFCTVYDDARAFAAGLQQDDVAILTLRRTDPAGPRDAVRSARGISRRSPDPSP
nr:hypothetical protein OH820_33015 [Streptomyces sp. NBC_00857]